MLCSTEPGNFNVWNKTGVEKPMRCCWRVAGNRGCCLDVGLSAVRGDNKPNYSYIYDDVCTVCSWSDLSLVNHKQEYNYGQKKSPASYCHRGKCDSFPGSKIKKNTSAGRKRKACPPPPPPPLSSALSIYHITAGTTGHWPSQSSRH